MLHWALLPTYCVTLGQSLTLSVAGVGGPGAAQGPFQLRQSVICSISATQKAFRMSNAMFSCSFGIAFVPGRVKKVG